MSDPLRRFFALRFEILHTDLEAIFDQAKARAVTLLVRSQNEWMQSLEANEARRIPSSSSLQSYEDCVNNPFHAWEEIQRLRAQIQAHETTLHAIVQLTKPPAAPSSDADG